MEQTNKYAGFLKRGFDATCDFIGENINNVREGFKTSSQVQEGTVLLKPEITGRDAAYINSLRSANGHVPYQEETSNDLDDNPPSAG